MRGLKPAEIAEDACAIEVAPEAPEWLSEDAKIEWGVVAPALVERRILTVADLGNLANYCLAVGQVKECQRMINQRGLVIANARGTRKHPAVGIQADAMTRARLLGAELGLTPVSRSRRGMAGGGDADSLVDW